MSIQEDRRKHIGKDRGKIEGRAKTGRKENRLFYYHNIISSGCFTFFMIIYALSESLFSLRFKLLHQRVDFCLYELEKSKPFSCRCVAQNSNCPKNRTGCPIPDNLFFCYIHIINQLSFWHDSCLWNGKIH